MRDPRSQYANLCFADIYFLDQKKIDQYSPAKVWSNLKPLVQFWEQFTIKNKPPLPLATSIAIVLQNASSISVTYSGRSRQQTHSLCVGMVAYLSQVHHRAFSNRSLNSTWLSSAESLARSGFKSSHTKAQKNKQTLGRNDVTDMRLGLQDPFKVAAPSVELFTSFSLGSHQKRKQRWVTQLNVNFLLVLEKNTRFLEWPSPLNPKLKSPESFYPHHA